MTDAELIAALGWEPCKRYDDARRGCATHPDDGGMWVIGDQWCLHMTHALIGARAGIDLARERIAQAMRSNSRPADPALSPLMRLMTVPSERPVSWEQVARIVSEWQP